MRAALHTNTENKSDLVDFLIQNEIRLLTEQILRNVEISEGIGAISNLNLRGFFVNNPKPIHDQLFEPEY